MQLSPDSGNIDDAIKELQREIPIEALWSILQDRKRRHKKYKHVQRHRELLKAGALRD
jgi:hypothetical protein